GSVVRVGDGARRSRTTGQRPAERGVPEVAALDDHIDAPAAAATRLCSGQVRRADDLPRDRRPNLNLVVRWIEDRQRGCTRTPACARRLTQGTRVVAGWGCCGRRGRRPRGGRGRRRFGRAGGRRGGGGRGRGRAGGRGGRGGGGRGRAGGRRGRGAGGRARAGGR